MAKKKTDTRLCDCCLCNRTHIQGISAMLACEECEEKLRYFFPKYDKERDELGDCKGQTREELILKLLKRCLKSLYKSKPVNVPLVTELKENLKEWEEIKILTSSINAQYNAEKQNGIS